MKNLLPLLAIVVFFGLACTRSTNETLLDSQVPPDEQLIRISAEDLARDFVRGKKRSITQDNDADKKNLGKWLKVTGSASAFESEKNGFGYEIKLETFGVDPKVGCRGNYQENDVELGLRNGQEVTIVGRLVGGGNATTLYLTPCKFIKSN